MSSASEKESSNLGRNLIIAGAFASGILMGTTAANSMQSKGELALMLPLMQQLPCMSTALHAPHPFRLSFMVWEVKWAGVGPNNLCCVVCADDISNNDAVSYMIWG